MQITLRHGGRAAIIDTLGGELTSYRDEAGMEYIWQGDPASWTGRNPILFPIVGKLKDGLIMAGEKECRMPQHGFARRQEFTVTEQGQDFAVLELHETPDTLSAYPFPFLLQVRQQLKENSFTTTATVVNTGTEDMPFCLGAHTAFRCPQRPGERFEDYTLIFDHPESLFALLPTEGGLLDHKNTMPCLEQSDAITLDYAVFDQVDTLCFDGLRSQGVSLRHKEKSHGVHVDFTGFPMLALWTPPGKAAPFLCIEPWQGCAAYKDEDSQFAHKPYAVVLRPGESWSAGYAVTTL